MDDKCFIISLFTAITITVIALYKFKQNENNDKKSEFTQCTILFLVTFGIVFFISKMIIDSNDSKQMMNNIKSGDPPF
tara:strand:+ start:373 stop:606 length:234 start_codon:yes stop_codon:yes gene_type:complete